MARGGRKSKAGKREPNGQLQRVPKFDKGCEGVQRRRALYAQSPEDGGRYHDGNTFDAIGRAWSARLLGGNADEKLHAARTIAAQYWRIYGFSTPDSLARFQPSLGGGVPDPVKDKIREDALKDALAIITGHGRDYRKAFDQLVIEMNPDQGPAWLDRIIFHKADEGDHNMLRLAVKAIELLT